MEKETYKISMEENDGGADVLNSSTLEGELLSSKNLFRDSVIFSIESLGEVLDESELLMPVTRNKYRD